MLKDFTIHFKQWVCEKHMIFPDKCQVIIHVHILCQLWVPTYLANLIKETYLTHHYSSILGDYKETEQQMEITTSPPSKIAI